jgi:hypothetical protein
VTHHYDVAADDVFALLTDYDAVKAKYEALGHNDVELVERTDRAGAVTIVTKRVVPMDVPGFAKKILSPKNRVIQTDSWSAPDEKGVRSGTFTVDAKGVPVKVSGVLRLAPEPKGGCVSEIAATVECKVPLVGGKIADFVGADTKKAIDHELTFNQARLANR